MKTPFGPSLKAFGAFFNDKAADWDQLDWDKFDLSAFAATELAEDISIPVGTEFIEVAFEAVDRDAVDKIARQPERYVAKALTKGRTEASVKHMTIEHKDLMKAAKVSSFPEAVPCRQGLMPYQIASPRPFWQPQGRQEMY